MKDLIHPGVIDRAARNLVAEDINNNNAKQNSRQMFDWVRDNVMPLD